MARNGAGVFTPINLVTSGDTSDATLFNATMNDIAAALTASVAVDGQAIVTANIPLAGFKLTGVGAATARTDAASLANAQDGTGMFAVGGGSANAITATYTPAITAVVDGMLLSVRATAANTTATPTFSPNGLTARTIVKQGGQALVAGDIRAASHDLLLRYRATGTVWELLNPTIANAGTFTPTLGGSTGDGGAHTYSVQEGFYQRVGAWVTFNLRMTVTTIHASPPTGNVAIRGLPFAADLYGPCSVFSSIVTAPANALQLNWYANASTSTLAAEWQFTTGAASSNLLCTQIANGFNMSAGGVYRTNAA